MKVSPIAITLRRPSNQPLGPHLAQKWFTVRPSPCSPPQITKVQAAPCQSPPSSMVANRFA